MAMVAEWKELSYSKGENTYSSKPISQLLLIRLLIMDLWCSTRMCISYEFQRYIPLATVNASGNFHRRKSKEWLTHQATVAKQVMHGLHTVTGQGGNGGLTQRPFFVFWFMSQINRALSLWASDRSLTVALDVSKALLAPIDHLTALWPCPGDYFIFSSSHTMLTWDTQNNAGAMQTCASN